MFVRKNNVLKGMVLLVLLFSSLLFSTNVSAKKPILTEKEKQQTALEIQKLEKSNKNLLSQTKATEKSLLPCIKETKYTIELLKKVEKKTNTSFKDTKKDLLDSSKDMSSINSILYVPQQAVSVEIKTLKGIYKTQSYKENMKEIKGIKKDISEGLNMMKDTNDMVDTVNQALNEIQKEVKPLL